MRNKYNKHGSARWQQKIFRRVHLIELRMLFGRCAVEVRLPGDAVEDHQRERHRAEREPLIDLRVDLGLLLIPWKLWQPRRDAHLQCVCVCSVGGYTVR